MLGDPFVRTALVAPITAEQARVVFQHRRRAYPGHTYLVVLHGDFVSPQYPCPAEAAGCPLYIPHLFGWEVMLASPTLGPEWRRFGIETDRRPRSVPVALRRIGLPAGPRGMPSGLLLRLAMSGAERMGGSNLIGFGFAHISAAAARRLFGGRPPSGYVVVERGIFRHLPGAASDRKPWFSWAVLEYAASGAAKQVAAAVLPRPRSPNAPLPGIRVRWAGVPMVVHG